MITVRVFYIDGHDELKDCFNIEDICLDGVIDIRTIRAKE